MNEQLMMAMHKVASALRKEAGEWSPFNGVGAAVKAPRPATAPQLDMTAIPAHALGGPSGGVRLAGLGGLAGLAAGIKAGAFRSKKAPFNQRNPQHSPVKTPMDPNGIMNRFVDLNDNYQDIGKFLPENHTQR